METQLADKQQVSGLILAGGEGRRMAGQDKGLICLGDKPLVEFAIECMQSLVDDLTISCNRNLELYQNYQLSCFADARSVQTDDVNLTSELKFAGPMAGLAAGLAQAKHEWLLVMPCDTPLMTDSVMAQLLENIEPNCQAIIFSHQGLQPLHGLYHKSMLPIFEKCLAENKNALQRLLRSLDTIKIVDAKDCKYSFNNANDANELSEIENIIAKLNNKS